jgi:hypothetical protein
MFEGSKSSPRAPRSVMFEGSRSSGFVMVEGSRAPLELPIREGEEAPHPGGREGEKGGLEESGGGVVGPEPGRSGDSNA